MTRSAPAPGTAARPVRVTVVGSSCSYMVVPRKTADDRSYGQVLPDLLAQRGVHARVFHSSRWFGMIQDVRRRYEPIRDTMPDVVVLNFGMGEAQPRLVPTWLMDHLTTWDRSSHPAALGYRRHVASRGWRFLRRAQRRGALRDRRTHRLSPQRFRHEVQELARRLRTEVTPLVLFLDLDPPGSRVLHWMPGLDERAARFNDVLQAAVDDLGDPEVRVVSASRTVGDDVDVLLPDGFHRCAEGHRRTAALLADVICDWLPDTPHADAP